MVGVAGQQQGGRRTSMAVRRVIGEPSAISRCEDGDTVRAWKLRILAQVVHHGLSLGSAQQSGLLWKTSAREAP